MSHGQNRLIDDVAALELAQPGGELGKVSTKRGSNISRPGLSIAADTTAHIMSMLGGTVTGFDVAYGSGLALPVTLEANDIKVTGTDDDRFYLVTASIQAQSDGSAEVVGHLTINEGLSSGQFTRSDAASVTHTAVVSAVVLVASGYGPPSFQAIYRTITFPVGTVLTQFDMSVVELTP